MTAVKIDAQFSFRKNKEDYKRPTVEVSFPGPSQQDIATILTASDSDPKVVSLIVDTVQGLLTSHIRSFVDADMDFDQAKLDALVAEDKISLRALANMPASERNTLTKEDLDNFSKSYIEVMHAHTDKALNKIQAAAGLFVEKFKRVAGQDEVLTILKAQLEQYIEHAGEALAENEKAVTYLSTKLDELLSVNITANDL